MFYPFVEKLKSKSFTCLLGKKRQFLPVNIYRKPPSFNMKLTMRRREDISQFFRLFIEISTLERGKRFQKKLVTLKQLQSVYIYIITLKTFLGQRKCSGDKIIGL
jgi:hypothetical protein